MIRAVLFDCDGVVINSMPLHAAAWCDLFARYGMRIEPIDVYLEEGRDIVDFAGLILRRNGHQLQGLTPEQLAKEKEDFILAEGKIRIFPEIEHVLNEVKAHDRALGMVTGSNQRLVRNVIPAHVLRQFDVIVTADDVDRGKPAPDPYLRAAEKLAMSPADCLVVENAPLGIQAAKAAGMPVIGLTTTLPAKHLRQADWIAGSFKELRELLRSKLLVHSQ